MLVRQRRSLMEKEETVDAASRSEAAKHTEITLEEDSLQNTRFLSHYQIHHCSSTQVKQPHNLSNFMLDMDSQTAL